MKLDFETYLSKTGEIGFVERTISSLVYVQGLPGAKPEEVVVFENGEIGQVLTLGENSAEILGFSKKPLRADTKVARTDRVFEIPVGVELLGTTINSLGHSIDPTKPLPPLREFRPINTVPSGIQTRAKIKTPCDTGVTLVDLMIPLGRGQRELIIGDQKTGKSRFLLRTLLTQVKQGAIGVYASIGKSQMGTRQIEEWVRRAGITDQSVFVVAGAGDGAGMIYLAPYTAMTIAEYFRDQGKNVLVILDDLSIHAKAYREIALSARRFPGRNSYPGDIFYTHARLLERAGNFKTASGEGAITCLPVIEAAQGDITGYIQTNVMSMTDGHILFDHTLFAEGRRPAVDIFLSVTRVGRQAQSDLKREIGHILFTFMRQMDRLHSFATFGAELSDNVKHSLDKESRLMQFFDQTAYDSIPSSVQIFIFGLIWGDFWSEKKLSEIPALVQKIIFLYEAQEAVRKRIDEFIKSSNSVESLVNRLKFSTVLTDIII